MAGTGESKQDGLGLSGTNPKVGQFSSFPASAESLRCSDETRVCKEPWCTVSFIR